MDNNIDDTVQFRRNDGEIYKIETKYVHLKSLIDHTLVFKFEAPKDILYEGEDFFKPIAMNEDIKVDIGGTGDIPCSFKTLSPIADKGEDDGVLMGLYTIVIQEIRKAPDLEEEENCETCMFYQECESKNVDNCDKF